MTWYPHSRRYAINKQRVTYKTGRYVVTLIGSVAVIWPLATRAQQSKVARIGALYLGMADAETSRTGLREGLREPGHVEGRDIGCASRSAEGRPDGLPEAAAERVLRKGDVIVA